MVKPKREFISTIKQNKLEKGYEEVFRKNLNLLTSKEKASGSATITTNGG